LNVRRLLALAGFLFALIGASPAGIPYAAAVVQAGRFTLEVDSWTSSLCGPLHSHLQESSSEEPMEMNPLRKPA